MTSLPFLTVLCLSPGNEQELLTLLVEYHKQSYSLENRELIIIDDGSRDQQSVVTTFLSFPENKCCIYYHHLSQSLLPEERVQSALLQAKGEYFQFITTNTYYHIDYFIHSVNAAQNAPEKMVGSTQEHLWFPAITHFCSRKTRLPQYSALNALCCHNSILANRPFLQASNGWEVSLTQNFSEYSGELPIICLQDIKQAIYKGALINTQKLYQKPPPVLQTLPVFPVNWDFFDHIAFIKVQQQSKQEAFSTYCAHLQIPQHKVITFSSNTDSKLISGFIAHRDALKFARDNQWENILIWQDNVRLVQQQSVINNLNNLLMLLKNNPWTVIILAAQYKETGAITGIEHIITVKDLTEPGAYAVHKSYFAILIDLFEQKINQLLSSSNPNITTFSAISFKNHDSWLGVWPVAAFPEDTDDITAFFQPQLALNHEARQNIERSLLEKGKWGTLTTEEYHSLADFNHKIQRYELRDYYAFKASGKLPQIKKDTHWPLLSVIIPTYNQVKHLQEAVESIRRQSYPNLEIIVADDHSMDGTQAYMESFIDLRVCYLRNPGNLGAMKNYMATHQKYDQGKYVMFFDHDDLLTDRHYLWDAVQILEEDENIALVFANYHEWYTLQNTIIASHPGPNINKIKGRDYFWQYGFSLRNPMHLVTVYRRQTLEQAQSCVIGDKNGIGDLHANVRIMLFGDVGFISGFPSLYRIHEENLTFHQSTKNDISVDIAFMQDMEKTRTIALEQGMEERKLHDWFNKMSINHFVGWRMAIALHQKQYATVLSLFTWINQYYHDIGRSILPHLLKHPGFLSWKNSTAQ